MPNPLQTAEHIITLLDQGAYESTYKQAVLVALMDLCLAHTDAKGAPPQAATPGGGT